MARLEREMAEKEFDRFVEFLNMSELKKAKFEEEKDDIVRLIEFGYLVIEDETVDAYLEHALKMGENSITKLSFKKRRYTVKEVENLTKGSQSDMESARRLLGSLTGINSAILKEMDSDDFVNLGKISAFFLPR